MVDVNTTRNRRRFLKYTSAALGASVLAGCTQSGGGGSGDGGDSDGGSSGSTYPNQKIRKIIPYESGGGTDTYLRQIGQFFPDYLDVDAEFVNVPGASGLRGISRCFNADPDGYTMVGVNPPAELLPVLLDPSSAEDVDLTAMEPVCAFGFSSFMIVANTDAGLDGFEDMKKRYSNGEFETIGGTGISSNMNAILIRQEMGLEWDEYIGYPGSAPAMQAVSSGEVPVAIPTTGTAKSAVQEGLVEPIAVLRSDGSNVFPDTSTVTDLGYPNIDYLGTVTRGYLMPPDTPEDRIATIEQAAKEIIESDAMQQWSEDTGRGVAFGSRDEMRSVWQGGFENIRKKIDLEQFREETS